MANQRPIRRGRFPRFRRGRRRPTRWIDANSTQINAPCTTEVVELSCDPAGGPRELLVGDLDIDWSDKSEVTIQRIVGSILLSGISNRTTPTAGGLILPYAVMVRMGILVVEDTDRVYNAIDLGDPESLEEYEWMWLHNTLLEASPIYVSSDELVTSITRAVVPVDIGVKRKLGKKDSLVLYAQHALHAATPTSFLFQTFLSEQLRTVLSS